MTDLRVIHYQEHRIHPSQIASSTLWVVSTLRSRGYQAYVVGGCIRDLLFNRQPKDFDVVTNARPHQIKEMFRHAFIIGRRFQLVHILSGDHTIEVATFRSKPTRLSKLGKLLKLWQHKRGGGDNTFGTIEEDALRRDLTINALYYNPQEKELLDYVGGYKDIKDRRVNVIGVAEERFAEDPMRMIRIIRFMAKLNLTINSDLAQIMIKHFHFILHLPPARLRDEMEKLFLTGHGWTSFLKLEEYKLLHFFLPVTVEFLHRASPSNRERCYEMIKNALINADQRYKAGKPVDVAFSLAVFLWFPYLARCQRPLNLSKEEDYRRHRKIMEAIMNNKKNAVRIPRYLYHRVERIWRLQNSLLNYNKINIRKVMEHRNFRTAYDFLKAQSSVEPRVAEAAQWWKEYQRNHPPPIISHKRRRARKRVRR